MRRQWPTAVFVFLLLATGAHAASAPALVTGHQSPLGLPFSSFANPALMADGRVVFLGSSSGAFRRALVLALREEGVSIPAIARMFGVTHQRVSNLLRGGTGC